MFSLQNRGQPCLARNYLICNGLAESAKLGWNFWKCISLMLENNFTTLLGQKPLNLHLAALSAFTVPVVQRRVCKHKPLATTP